MGFNCLRATEPLRGDSLLFIIQFPGVPPATDLIDLRRMKGWIDRGATQWFCTLDPRIGAKEWHWKSWYLGGAPRKLGRGYKSTFANFLYFIYGISYVLILCFVCQFLLQWCHNLWIPLNCSQHNYFIFDLPTVRRGRCCCWASLFQNGNSVQIKLYKL